MSGNVERLPAVDERQVVLVQGVQDELDADEAEQDGETDAEVDEPLEQAADEEVELPQTHQREDVRREDEVGLLGQAVDRGDRVEREEQVGRAQREDDDDHRRDEALAVLDDREMVPCHSLVAGKRLSTQSEEAVLVVLVVVGLAALGQLDRPCR